MSDSVGCNIIGLFRSMLFISFRGKDDLLRMYCYFPVILLVNFVKVAPVIVVTL